MWGGEGGEDFGNKSTLARTLVFFVTAHGTELTLVSEF